MGDPPHFWGRPNTNTEIELDEFINITTITIIVIIMMMIIVTFKQICPDPEL